MKITLTSLVLALVCQHAIAAPVLVHQEAMLTEPWPRSNDFFKEAGRPRYTPYHRRALPIDLPDSARHLHKEDDKGGLLVPLPRRAILLEEGELCPGHTFVAVLAIPARTSSSHSGQELEVQDPRWTPGKWSYIGGGLGSAAVGVLAQQLLKKIINEQKKREKEGRATPGNTDPKGGQATKTDPSDVPGKPGRQNRRDLSIDDINGGELYSRQHRWSARKKWLWVGGGLGATALGFTGGVVLKNLLQKANKERRESQTRQPTQQPKTKQPHQTPDDPEARNEGGPGRHNRRDLPAGKTLLLRCEDDLGNEDVVHLFKGSSISLTDDDEALITRSLSKGTKLGISVLGGIAALGAGWGLYRKGKMDGKKEAEHEDSPTSTKTEPAPAPGTKNKRHVLGDLDDEDFDPRLLRTAMAGALREYSTRQQIAMGASVTAGIAATAGLGAMGWKLHRDWKKAKKEKEAKKQGKPPASAPTSPRHP